MPLPADGVASHPHRHAGGTGVRPTFGRRDRAAPPTTPKSACDEENLMDVHEVMNHARDAMTVKRVFGDPYEKDGVTVIPVASIMGGAGAGGGTGVGARPEGANEETGEAGATGAADSGYGMGYGLRATPAGVY